MAVIAHRNARHAAIVAEQRELGIATHPHFVTLLLSALAAAATASSLASLFNLG